VKKLTDATVTNWPTPVTDDRGLRAPPAAGFRPRGKVPGQGESESFEAFAHLKKAQKAVQGGCMSIFQISGAQVLPSREGAQGGECPLPMPMGAHGHVTHVPLAHPSPQLKRHLDPVQPFLHSKAS